MTSSSSSSSSRLALPLLAVLAFCGCRAVPQGPAPGAPPEVEAEPAAPPASRPAPAPAPRLALFPVQNLTGGAAPTKEVTAALRERLEKGGIALVPDDRVRKVLAARRIRYTGGIDRETAAALRKEAEVDGVIIAALEGWGTAAPFRMAMTARLVSTDPEPTIRWLDAFARSGVDAPGPLRIDVVEALEPLRDQALDQLAGSLAASLAAPRAVPTCPEWSARAPDLVFRSPLAADPERRTLAVLPFMGEARRRDAGEVIALRVLAPLVASGTLQVVEPGVVRSEMLAYRFGATGGISLDDARTILELLHADLVLSGTVRTFEDAAGAGGAPIVEFSTWVLDRKTGKQLWSSTATAGGEDGVVFFGRGRVTTASALACSMAKGVAELLLRDRAQVASPPWVFSAPAPGAPPAVSPKAPSEEPPAPPPEAAPAEPEPAPEPPVEAAPTLGPKPAPEPIPVPDPR